MNLEATPLSDALLWLRGSGLEIVLLVLGAVLLTRFATWLAGVITARIDAHAGGGDGLVYCVTAVLIVQKRGVPVTGLVAPAAVAGVALGFGAQRLVQDLLAGFFIITEKQYGFGALIRLHAPGLADP